MLSFLSARHIRFIRSRIVVVDQKDELRTIWNDSTSLSFAADHVQPLNQLSAKRVLPESNSFPDKVFDQLVYLRTALNRYPVVIDMRTCAGALACCLYLIDIELVHRNVLVVGVPVPFKLYIGLCRRELTTAILKVLQKKYLELGIADHHMMSSALSAPLQRPLNLP